jgi:hypothetical protein
LELNAKRIKEIGNRDATRLTNGLVRVVVDDKGGMIPELSYWRENGYLNTHWLPHFRSNSGRAYSKTIDSGYWGSELLYEIAGNFPCVPNFGLPGKANGVEYPQHGTTSNNKWKLLKSGVLAHRAAFAVSTLKGERTNEFTYKKYDILLEGHPVHYAVLKIRSHFQKAARITAAWHNTLGSPFLEKGCLIDVSASRFATVPSPSEFDTGSRLAIGTEFTSLSRAPFRNGKHGDIRLVPGMIGYSDFCTGPVPRTAHLGWSSVVNPSLKSIYLCYFKGPAAAGKSDLILYFNDLWMQYGGRKFTPWASSAEGSDMTFCLGTENSVGAFANGIQYSLAHPELLGSPTSVEILPGEEQTLYYASLAAGYSAAKLQNGVAKVEIDKGSIAVVGRPGSGSATQKIKADPSFAEIEHIVSELG